MNPQTRQLTRIKKRYTKLLKFITLYTISFLLLLLLWQLNNRIVAVETKMEVLMPRREMQQMFNEISKSKHLTQFEALQITWSIFHWSEYYQVSPDIVKRLMRAESSFVIKALGPCGEMGLMQVRLYHFRFGENPYDIDTNIHRGTELLSRCRKKWGTYYDAVLCYNGSNPNNPFPISVYHASRVMNF